jgi:hypothetical protein
MAEEPKTSSFLDRLKDATQVVVEKTRDGVEDLQQKHELSQTYGDLGRKTFELVDSGAITHPELTEMVNRIRELKTELAAEAAPAEAAPAAEPPATPES